MRGGRWEKEGRSCSSHAEGVLTHEEGCHGTGYPPSHGGDKILLERGTLAVGDALEARTRDDLMKSFAFGGQGVFEGRRCRDNSGRVRVRVIGNRVARMKPAT